MRKRIEPIYFHEIVVCHHRRRRKINTQALSHQHRSSSGIKPSPHRRHIMLLLQKSNTSNYRVRAVLGFETGGSE